MLPAAQARGRCDGGGEDPETSGRRVARVRAADDAAAATVRCVVHAAAPTARAGARGSSAGGAARCGLARPCLAHAARARRIVGFRRVRASAGRRVAAAGVVALVAGAANDRGASLTGTRAARVRHRALVAVIACCAVRLRRVRAGAGRWIASPRFVARVRHRARHGGARSTAPHHARVGDQWKAKAPNHLTLTPYSDAGEHYTLSIAGDGSGFKITSASGTTERFLREGASGEPSGPFCGGIAGIQCDGGLTCVLDGDFPDAGGTCTDCPIPSCAPPPADCHYEAAGGPVTACPSGCGTLVCGPSGA